MAAGPGWDKPTQGTASGPTLPGVVHIAEDKQSLHQNLAWRIIAAADDAVSKYGLFHLALSGGSTPEPFYQALVTDPQYRSIPWEKTHIWQVDERRVDDDDPKRNWLMIRQSLADHVPIPQRQLHPMPVQDDEPASRYERELAAAFDSSTIRLDLILLGMGDDGHTASLFPQSPAIEVTGSLVAVNDGPNVVPPARVTLTFDAIRQARRVAVLVVGQDKADMLARVATQLHERGPDLANLPITVLGELWDKTSWHLDVPAAAKLGL